MSEKNTWPKQKNLEAQSSAIALEERVWGSWTRFQVNRNMVKSNNYLNKMRIKWIADIICHSFIGLKLLAIIDIDNKNWLQIFVAEQPF